MALAINKEFAINANTSKTVGNLLIVHSTDDVDATARNGAIYENRVWQSAQTFVHFFVDDTSIYQVGTPGYKAWGAGNVNKYAPVQIELCEFSDRARSIKAYKNFIALVKQMAARFGIPLTLDDANKTAGIKSHAWCSKNYGGSDHLDPYPWLNSIGISKAQFEADIKGAKITAPTTSVPKKSSSNVGANLTNKTTYQKTDAVVNVRRSQTTKSDVIRTLAQDTVFKSGRYADGENVDGHAYKWFEVNGSGWVYGGLITPVAKPASFEQIKVDGYWGNATTRRIQQVLGVTADGLVGPNTYRAIQKAVGVTADGIIGPNTIKAMQRRFGTGVDGRISKPSAMIKAMQSRLNQNKF